MNHQPFETWVIRDEPLTKEEEQMLRKHLESCSQCSELSTAWRSVENRMSSSPMAEPMPGFMDRFKAKLDDELIKRRKRQTRFALGFSSSAALVFLAIWIVNFGDSIGSPTQFAIDLAADFKGYLSFINTLKEVSISITQVLPGVVPISMWLIAAAIISLLVATWFISIHRLTVQRRVLS